MGSRDERPQAQPFDGADEALAPLTLAEADALILCTVEEFQRQGRSCRYDGTGTLVCERGTVDLRRLAQAAALTSPVSWRGLVSRFVHGALTDDSPPQEFEHARALVVPQVQASAAGPGDGAPPAQAVLPGISVCLVLDYVDRMSEPLPAEVIEHYGGWDVVAEQAIANLRQLPPPRVQDIIADEDRDDATVHVLRYEDAYGAARVLLRHELLASIGVEAPSHGVLVAIPSRHVLAVHVVRGEGVVPALRRLLQIALREHLDQPGPISPHVFFWGASGAQQLTLGADDSVEVEVTGEFKDVLVQLGLVAE